MLKYGIKIYFILVDLKLDDPTFAGELNTVGRDCIGQRE
jgi:hypothetical protein